MLNHTFFSTSSYKTHRLYIHKKKSTNNLLCQDSPIDQYRMDCLVCIVPPKFTKELKDTSCLLENRIEISCTANGIPTPTFTWSKDGKKLAPNESLDIQTDKSSTCVVLSNVTLEDEGKYEVVAVNVAGSAKSGCLFIVHGKSIKTDIWQPFTDKYITLLMGMWKWLTALNRVGGIASSI